MPSPAAILRRHRTLRDHRIRSLPVLVLMPHSRCNCRCVMCDIWKANAMKNELSPEALAPHLDAIAGWDVRWVVLSGGEALLHPNLWTLCAAIREKLGARISLLSTGLLLRRHAEDVVRWCDDVIVSLDGPEAVHDEIRNIPRAFAKLADGVTALREIRSDYRVTARSVVQRRNLDLLGETVTAARTIGLDSISFLPADVSSEAFNRPGGWDDRRQDDVAPSPDEARRAVASVERLLVDHAEDIARGFVVERPDKLRAIGRYFLALHGESDFPEVRCNAPWTSSVVEADGTVRPCFFHPPFGNVADAPLDEILNAPAALDWRRRLDVATDPVCGRCVCSLHLRPWDRV